MFKTKALSYWDGDKDLIDGEIELELSYDNCYIDMEMFRLQEQLERRN